MYLINRILHPQKMSTNNPSDDLFGLIIKKKSDTTTQQPKTLSFEADERIKKERPNKKDKKFLGEEVEKATDLDVDFSNIIRAVDGSVDPRLRRRFENAKLLALGAVAPKKKGFNLKEHKKEVAAKKEHLKAITKEAKDLGLYRYVEGADGKKKMIVNTTQIEMMNGNISETIELPKLKRDKKVYRK